MWFYGKRTDVNAKQGTFRASSTSCANIAAPLVVIHTFDLLSDRAQGHNVTSCLSCLSLLMVLFGHLRTSFAVGP